VEKIRVSVDYAAALWMKFDPMKVHLLRQAWRLDSYPLIQEPLEQISLIFTRQAKRAIRKQPSFHSSQRMARPSMKFPQYSKFLSNFAWQSILLICRSCFCNGHEFAISMIIARVVGKGVSMGVYIFLISIVNWVGLVFTFGLDSVPKMLAAVQET